MGIINYLKQKQMKFTTLIALVGVATAIRIVDGPSAEDDAAAKKKLADPKKEEGDGKAKFSFDGPSAEEDAAAKKKLADPKKEEGDGKAKFSFDGPSAEEDAAA